MPHRSGSSGFSLIELAVVLFIVSLLLGVFVSAGTGFLSGKTVEEDRKKLQAIETALAGYVSVNGRLPCPANGNLVVTDPLAGSEVRDANGDCTSGNVAIADQRTGVVPWTTIAITEADASDSNLRRITYRVAYGLTRNGSMDFTNCDPAGTGAANTSGTSSLPGCTAACLATCLTSCAANTMALCTPPSAVLPAGRGILVRNDVATSATVVIQMDTSVTPTQGAAYVLISHGRQGTGAYNRGSGVLLSGSSGTKEAQNANNQVMAGWYAIDTNISETNDANHFDDLILRPSIMRVVLQAQRGPRAH